MGSFVYARTTGARHGGLVAWCMCPVFAMLSKERVDNNIMSPLGYASSCQGVFELILLLGKYKKIRRSWTIA